MKLNVIEKIHKVPERILIVCPSWVGDTIMAIPAFKGIREGYPGAEITLLARPYVIKLVEGLPYFDHIIEYDPKGKDKGIYPYLLLLKKLRKSQFDLAAILPNSFASALITFLAGIPCRVGYDQDARKWLLTDRIQPPKEDGIRIPVPMVERYLKICEYLNGKVTPARAHLVLNPEAEAKAESIYSEQGIIREKICIVITPGAAFGSSKLWKPEYFAEVADLLIEKYSCRVMIVPGPGEEVIALRIEELMKYKPINLVESIVPLDLLASIIKRASLLITNDTGPRHIAFALKRPAVVLMGPTDPRYSSCHVDERTLVLRKDFPCAPCHLKVCPREHVCMDSITPQEVFEASCSLIERFAEV